MRRRVGLPRPKMSSCGGTWARGRAATTWWRSCCGQVLCLCILFLLASPGHARGPESEHEADAAPSLLEAVVIVSEIGRVLPAFTEALQWDVLAELEADASLAQRWGLPADVTMRQVVVGRTGSANGLVRLVEIDGVDQKLIRPGGSWWDIGGTRNLNVLVRDTSAMESALRTLGWSARSAPTFYERPGGVRGSAMSMVGPDDLVLSFQGRVGPSPAVDGEGDFRAATRLQTGYQVLADVESWRAFFSDVVGFDTNARNIERGETRAGPNGFGLPHNATGLLDLVMGGARFSNSSQFLGFIHFTKATGFDYASRAHPPNLGIAVLRVEVADIHSLHARFEDEGIDVVVPLAEHRMAPYGTVKSATVIAPGGSAQWIEFIERVHPPG